MVTYTDVAPILTAVTDVISTSNIIQILVIVVGACVGFVFMWWGVRKLVSAVMSAFRKGKLSI